MIFRPITNLITGGDARIEKHEKMQKLERNNFLK